MGRFFEGDDFKGVAFKALTPDYYPLPYKKYIAQEERLIADAVSGARRVLEAGVGTGRLIPVVAPLAAELVCIDNASRMLREAQVRAHALPNVRVVNDAIERLPSRFEQGYFDISLCTWNTLGNVEDEALALKAIAAVTSGRIIVTVCRKGSAKEKKEFYSNLGVEIERYDARTETFYSRSGLRSRHYSLDDLKRIAKDAGLKVASSRTLGGVMLWAELVSIPQRAQAPRPRGDPDTARRRSPTSGTPARQRPRTAAASRRTRRT